MFNLKMHTGNGESFDLSFPQNHNEWPVRNYLKYIVQMEKYSAWLETDDSVHMDLMEFRLHDIIFKAKANAAFFDLSYEDFFEVEMAHLEDDDSVSSLTTLYNMIGQYCNKIDITREEAFDKTYMFEYKDKLFGVNPIIVHGVSGVNRFDLKLGQLVEILEKRRLLANHKSLQVDDPDSKTPGKKKFVDPEGSFRFNSFLLNLAVLAEDTENKMPRDSDGFDRMVEEKRVFFKDIDIQTAMDVDFFLSVTLTVSRIIKPTDIFSTLQKYQDQVLKK